jgi:hypothetical protein
LHIHFLVMEQHLPILATRYSVRFHPPARRFVSVSPRKKPRSRRCSVTKHSGARPIFSARRPSWPVAQRETRLVRVLGGNLKSVRRHRANPSEKVVCEKHGLPLISVIDRLPVNHRSPRVPWLRVRFQTRNQSERGELEEDLSLLGENRHRNSGRSNGSKHFARKYFCLDAYFSCIAR